MRIVCSVQSHVFQFYIFAFPSPASSSHPSSTLICFLSSTYPFFYPSLPSPHYFLILFSSLIPFSSFPLSFSPTLHLSSPPRPPNRLILPPAILSVTLFPFRFPCVPFHFLSAIPPPSPFHLGFSYFSSYKVLIGGEGGGKHYLEITFYCQKSMSLVLFVAALWSRGWYKCPV